HAEEGIRDLNVTVIQTCDLPIYEKIYAAGDVTLGPQFVYVAAYEGGIAADNAIGGLNKKIDLSVFPGVTFTNPSIATVGLTEEQAKEKGYEVKTSVLPLDAVP